MRLWGVLNWISFPVTAQRNVLQHLVTQAQYTEFGRKYSFSKLFTVKDFKKNIPIHDYNDIKPYIERMMKGEESIKDIHFKASKDVVTNYYKNFPDSDLLTGKSLVVGGSHQVHNLQDDIQYGDLSAVLMQNTPFWGHWIRTPELSIALLDELSLIHISEPT